MDVLILSNNGMGLYKFRKELIKSMLDNGHSVIIAMPYDQYGESFELMGCDCVYTQVDRRGINPIKDVNLMLNYLALIKRVDPSVVLTYTIKPNIYGGIACQIRGKDYLSNVTGLGTAIEKKGLLKDLALFLYKVGLKGARRVFFQNADNYQYFMAQGIVSSNAEIIPGSGVNIIEHQFEEYPQDDDIVRLLFVGRIMKAKGIDELLEAAVNIRKMTNRVEFHIVGFCEEDYQEKITQLASKNILFFHGIQDNVHDFIKGSHAVVHPSHHEGLSNVLLEAASAGRPVLASAIAGCRETFEEGITGLGFQPKCVEDLVDKINKFVDLPYEAKKQMGIMGRAKIEAEFDRKLVIDAYLKQIFL